MRVLMIAQSFYDYDSRILRQTSTLVKNFITADIICLGDNYIKHPIIDNVNVYRIMTKFEQDKVVQYANFSFIEFFKKYN